LSLYKKVFLPFIAFLSILFFLSLFYAVRFEGDDMVLSLVFRENSFFTSFEWYHQHFSFRPAVLFLVFATLGSDDPHIYPYTIFTYFTLIYCFWVWTLYKILGVLFPLLKDQKYFLSCFSVVQITAIYFLCTDRIEVFGWASSSMLYLVPVVLSSYAAYLLIKPQLKRIEYAGLFASAGMIGGCLEYVAVFDLILGGAMILYFLNKRRKGDPVRKEKLFRPVFFTSVLAVFSAFCILNPGILERFQGMNELARADAYAGGPYSQSFLTMFFKPHKLIGIALIFISWWFILNSATAYSITKRGIIAVVFCLIVAVALTIASSQLSYHTLSVGRMWFLTDVMIYVLAVALLLYFLPKTVVPVKVFYALALLFCAVFSFYCVKHIRAQWIFVSRYDKVIEHIKSSPNEKLIVVGLPKPDLGSAASLYNEPGRGPNRLFCRFYKINAVVSDSTAADRKPGN